MLITFVCYWNRRSKAELEASTRVCSCHFKDGQRSAGPTLFPWNKKKTFEFYSPEKKLVSLVFVPGVVPITALPTLIKF